MIDEEKSLLKMVALFIKQSPKHIAEAEAKAAKEAKRQARIKQLEMIAEKQTIKNAMSAAQGKDGDDNGENE